MAFHDAAATRNKKLRYREEHVQRIRRSCLVGVLYDISQEKFVDG